MNYVQQNTKQLSGLAELQADVFARPSDGVETFESRHALASLALKSLVDNLSKMSRFMAAKEERYTGEVTVVCSNETDVYVNFEQPFQHSNADFAQQWFESKDLDYRLMRMAGAFGYDTLHHDLRMSILGADSSVACYDNYYPVRFCNSNSRQGSFYTIIDQTTEANPAQSTGDGGEVESPSVGRKRRNRFGAKVGTEEIPVINASADIPVVLFNQFPHTTSIHHSAAFSFMMPPPNPSTTQANPSHGANGWQQQSYF
mmetsp:Transcript_10721/g.16142  ORF Transcript_10721/g.16142 Transcript_10721/m.16142 type:complete len:258 (+) Transcript_10721:3-776(+)